MKPEQRCIILIRIDNVLNHNPPIDINFRCQIFSQENLYVSLQQSHNSFILAVLNGKCTKIIYIYNDFDLQEDLKALKSWLDKSPHLKNARQGAKLFLDSAMSTDLHFLGFPIYESFFRRRQASPVPPRLQVQPWEDKGETWPLQLVQVETNLNAMSYFLSGGKV